MKAILALEDGTIYEGSAFGACGTVTGEVCFNTAVMGYQEIITDPSYNGQILAMTYPLIGNYGICADDSESDRPQIRALVAVEISRLHSSWRAAEPMEDWLKRYNIPGIAGVDTRKLAIHLREKGAMRACVSSELSADAAVAAARAATPMAGTDLISPLSTAQTYHWEGDSRDWKLPNKTMGDLTNYTDIAPAKYKAVAYDFGIKRSVLRALRRDGFDVTVVNAHTPAAEVLALAPDAVFLSSGPGDPAALGSIAAEIKQLLGKVPVFGLSLGMQLLGMALGATTCKLPFGHHGCNHPVKEAKSGQVLITTQNVDYALVADSLPADVEITHTNLNDGTVEGICCKSIPAMGVQFHPAPVPTCPKDEPCFFGALLQMVENFKTGQYSN
ncbi:MAG: glutamine-hydrolyzing carbamoyl-phosphate synthase small subunit [Akkermansia sp.]|nr:glutamine-hydrolyzing carbamoyl-phosphate synthase small subunit [Akkermansia sp.]